MTIGTKIKDLREKKHLSQQEVADEIGMTQSNYHKLESDKIQMKLNIMKKLASFFGIHTRELVDSEEEDPNWKIKQHNHDNHKVSAVTVNFSDEELMTMFKKQVEDKDEIIKSKDETIKSKDEIIKSKDEIIKSLRKLYENK